MRIWVKVTVVFLALVSIVVALLVVPPYLRNWVPAQQQGSPEQVVVLNVTEIKFATLPHEGSCRVAVNETHLVRECWFTRLLDSYWLPDGTLVSVRAPALREVNHTVVGVMDLEKMVSYVYEEVRFFKLEYTETEFDNYVLRMESTTPFEFKWVEPARPHLGSSAFSFDEYGASIPIVVFVYDDVNHTLYPALGDVVNATVDILTKFYAEPLEKLTGIPVRVTPIDPYRSCSWRSNVSADIDEITMDSYEIASALGCEVDLVKVVLIRSDRLLESYEPGIGRRLAPGVAVTWNRVALAITWPSYSPIRADTMAGKYTVLHEVGHTLGFYDVYSAIKRDWDKISLFLNSGSIMDNPVEMYVPGYGDVYINKLTLVDAAYLTYMMFDYAVLNRRGDLADRIYESLLRHGINVTERLRLLLPVTPNGDIARPYRDLVEMGIACVTTRGGRVILNADLLEAMQKIAQAALGKCK